jgi:F420-non-reducing hydrogenase large subunit
MSVEKAAKGMVHGPEVSEGMLNMVEMAFRPYDPCLACATHALGKTPLKANIYDAAGELIRTVTRD